MAVAAPIVFQCGSCRRVISDSNQLVAAVAELDTLILDAVTGVSLAEVGDSFTSLQCSSCKHPLGRCYSSPPQPALAYVVHQKDAPRYALSRASLESYMLGSAASGQLDGKIEDCGTGEAGASNGHDKCERGLAGAAAAALEEVLPSTRIEALERSDADVRVQLAQVMRVVLALDQRLRSLESDGGDAAESERKRQR